MVLEIDLGVLRLELDDEEVLADVDERLGEAMRAKHKEAFCELARAVDAQTKEARVCAVCGGQMRVHGTAPRRIGTLAGPVQIKRRRLRCLECGTERYLVDERLGLEGKHTLPAVERALFLATDMSYAKASRALRKLSGTEVSHGQIQSLAKREGALVGAELERMTRELFESGLDPGELVARSPGDTLVVTIDGGAIPDRANR